MEPPRHLLDQFCWPCPHVVKRFGVFVCETFSITLRRKNDTPIRCDECMQRREKPCLK